MRIYAAVAVLASILSVAPAAQSQNFCADCIEKKTQHFEPDGSTWFEVNGECCMAPCYGYAGFEMKDEDVGYGCSTKPVSDDFMQGDICLSSSDDLGCAGGSGGGGGGTDDEGDGTPCGGGNPGCGSPIILDLGSQSYRLTSAAEGVLFDLRAEGVPRRVAWTRTGVENAFLALDRNHNSRIDDGSELFGNYTPLRSGDVAQHGFEVLAELDANADGLIDKRDPIWNTLLLWIDRDHNGTSAPSELQRIADSPVKSLQTGYATVGRRDQWGNRYSYMSHFTLAEGRRAYYDVFFRIAN